MQSVTRHALGRSIDELRESATESDDALVSHFEDISLYPESTMPTAALAATSAAALHFGSDPSGARVETRVAARRAEQIYLGMYQLAALPPSEPFVLEMDSAGLRSHGTGHNPRAVNAQTWLDAYWWARATRNGTARETLDAVDPALLTQGSRNDAAMLGLVEALQARDRRDPQWAEMLSACVSQVNSPTISTKEEARLLQLDLFGVLATIGNEPDDQGNFTEQLTDALTDHRAFWGASEERSGTPRGFFSLPLFGLCAMAFDEGMTIDVDSDYLPVELIQNPPWMFELD